MKKLIKVAVALCLSLSIFAFTGCQNQTSDSDSKTNSAAASSKVQTNSSAVDNSASNSQNSTSNVQNSTNDTQSSSSDSQNSSSSSTSTVQPSQNTTLSFSQKIDAYLDGATINDAAFIDYFKNLGEYVADDKAFPSNAIFASPDATSGGNGKFATPYTLQDALENVKAGQTLYLRGGTYSATEADGFFIGTKGTATQYVTIRNYPGETPIITNSVSSDEIYGFQIEAGCAYTIIEGIEIANIAAQNAYGLVMWGNNQNHLIIRNLNIHDIKTTSKNPETDTNAGANAMLLFGENKNAISNVIIMNNYCHDNVTGWSETMSVASNCEYIYVLENTVDNNTNIGIDFYGNAGYCKTASLDQPRYSVASGNKISSSFCSYADCAGLYVDGARDILLQYNTVTNCQYGIEVGSEEKNESYPVKNITVRNNVLHDNTVVGIRVGGYEKNSTGVVYSTNFYNNTLIDNTKGSNGDAEIVIAKVNGINFTNNLVSNSLDGVLVKTDFSESYSQNITFENNFFKSGNNDKESFEFSMFTKTQVGVTAFCSCVGGNVITGALTLDQNFLPSASSVVVNSGKAISAGNYDYALNSRVVGSSIDIGALERQ